MPSPYWGSETIWKSQANAHNPMFDELGRVWFTSRIRSPGNPAFCKEGSDIPSAKLFPLENSGRQASMYDPKTQKFTLIDTCFRACLQSGFLLRGKFDSRLAKKEASFDSDMSERRTICAH
jgi:hypothetical protein